MLRVVRPRTPWRTLMLLIFAAGVVFLVEAIKIAFTTNRINAAVRGKHEVVAEETDATSETRLRTDAAVGDNSGRVQLTNGLNVHAWRVCGSGIEILRQWPFFPHSPDRKDRVTEFTSNFRDSEIGQRVFGLLSPPKDGSYQFALTATNASELWLSENEEPANVRLIASRHTATSGPSVHVNNAHAVSKSVHLKFGRVYFVESLHKNGPGKAQLSVLWKIPGATEFSVVGWRHLSPFLSHSTDDGHGAIASHLTRRPPEPMSEEAFQFYYKTPFLDEEYLLRVLPTLAYNPSYVVKNGYVPKWQGIYIALAHHTAIHPEDSIIIEPGSQITHSPRELGPNDVLPKATADEIVEQFAQSLTSHHNGRFALENVVAVEGKPDKIKGTRYLLELKLRDTRFAKSIRLSEYVFSDTDGHLWFPENFRWRKTATVYFIVPVKNQIGWVSFLVSEMGKLYQRTQDENFRLIVVDFESTDGDVESTLQESLLSRKYTLVKMSGAFYKTLAIQDAVKTITDPDSIVFLFDLHITVPPALLDSIRKHTIQGRAAFLPIVARLECGRSPVNPRGRWEESGSGLVAVYKSDWDRFHGMNVDEYKTTWGGEDWDLLDRMLRVGLESERLKIPGFYHYYHSKAALWGKAV